MAAPVYSWSGGDVTGGGRTTTAGSKPAAPLGSLSLSTNSTLPVVRGDVNIPDTGGYGAPDWGLIGQYAQMSPSEVAQIGAVTGYAKQLGDEGQGLFQASLPAYTASLNYMNQILGGGKAAAAEAVGPLAGNIADVYAGQRKAIEQSGLRGGARDTALAAAMQGQTRDIGNLLPQLQASTVQTAGQLGLAGAQAGGQFQQSAAALNQQVAQLYQQQQQFAIGAEQANRFGIGQLDVANRGLDIQQALGNKSIDLQQEGLTQQNNQFQQSFGLAQQNFGLAQQQFDWTKQYQQQLLQLQNQQLQAQQSAAQGSKWGGILGAGLTGASLFL